MRDINFFETYKKKTEEKKSPAFGVVWAVILLCVVIIIFGFYYIQRKELASIENQIAERTSNQEVLSQPADIEKSAELSKLSTYVTILRNFHEDLAAVPRLDAKMYSVINGKRPAGVTVEGIVYLDGILTVTGISETISAPADYAEALRNTGQFKNIRLQGNIYEETEALPDGTAAEAAPDEQAQVTEEEETAALQIVMKPVYRYTILCELKGGDEE